MRRRLATLALLALAGYALLVLAVYLAQDALVFPGAGHWRSTVDLAGVRTFELAGRDGPFRLAEAVPEQPRAVLVCFVGNGEDLRSGAHRAAAWARAGFAAVAPEYPGYGGSAGRPGVAAILAAAEATAAHARALATRLAVPLAAVGSSLGSFPAVHLAALGHAERLLLLAPPSRMVDAAAARFWWLPVGLLLRHPFDSLALAPRVRCPVLVVHGEADAVVPLALGERLAQAFAGPVEFVRLPGRGHNDLPGPGEGPVGARMVAFLAGG